MDPRSWLVRSRPGLWLMALAPVGALAADAALALPVGAAALVAAVGLEGWRWRLGRLGLRVSPVVATWRDWSGSWAAVQLTLGLGRAGTLQGLDAHWTVDGRTLPARIDFAPDGVFVGVATLVIAHDPLLVPPQAQLVVTLDVTEGDERHALTHTWAADQRATGRFANWLVPGRKGLVVDWQRFGRVRGAD